MHLKTNLHTKCLKQELCSLCVYTSGLFFIYLGKFSKQLLEKKYKFSLVVLLTDKCNLLSLAVFKTHLGVRVRSVRAVIVTGVVHTSVGPVAFEMKEKC